VNTHLRLGILTAVAILCAGGCGSTVAPTPPPPTEDPPTISCPAPLTLQLTGTASAVTATYTPTVVNGKAPVTTACTPPSGSSFGPGQSTVNCTATDALQRTSPCSFTITVSAAVPPKLTVTRFVSFGDSITAGEDGVDGGPNTNYLCVPKVAPTGGIRQRVILPVAQTYPGQLQAQLSARYTTQSPTVLNRGCPGESVAAPTGDTRTRFDAIVGTGQYDVVLIMEGSNDLYTPMWTDPVTQAANAIRFLVTDAKASGVRPLLATIPPMNPAGRRGNGAMLVPALNDRIYQVGAAENLAIVDVYAAFNGNLSLIGDDGLHPTAAGYQVIAKAFADAIKSSLEVKTTTLVPSIRRRR
jgi:lysophospholipase L1-like esterase